MNNISTTHLSGTIRAVLLGFFLALMVSIVLPTLTGNTPAYANPWLGTEVTVVISGPKATVPDPGGNPPGNPTETPGDGVRDTGSCDGLRPRGLRGEHMVALCHTRVADFRAGAGGDLARTVCPPSETRVGASWVIGQWWDQSNDSLVAGSMVEGNYRCISIDYNDVNVVCLNNASVNINMFTPANRGLSTVEANTTWGAGNHTYGGCLASSSLQASSYVPIVDYGRYSAQFNLYGVVAQFRVFGADPFTGVTRSPELLSSSAPQLRKTGIKYLQYTCAGATQSDTNSFGGSWTWTENDCAPGNSGGNSPTFQCVNMDSPTVNGVARSQINQILRDGDANSINWPTPNVTGGSLVSLTNPSTTLTVSGTPTFANSQVSLTRNGAGIFTNSSYTNSIATNYELKARWASDKDNPIVLSPSYSWLGTWNKTSFAITGVDFDAEEFIITPTTVQTQATVTCTPGNVSFDVLRATNG